MYRLLTVLSNMALFLFLEHTCFGAEASCLVLPTLKFQLKCYLLHMAFHEHPN